MMRTESRESDGSWERDNTRRMMSSGMLRRVALVRTDISEELSNYFFAACSDC
jgi:hypothetical protein